MRKIQKILTGIFLGGVLLGGIGTGMALVEYSSLTYNGEKVIGQENLVVRELNYTFVPGQEQVTIVRNHIGRDAILETDDTVPEGTIRYVVTYNEKTVRPTLSFWEEEPQQSDRPQREYEEAEGAGPEGEYGEAEGAGPEGEYGEAEGAGPEGEYERAEGVGQEEEYGEAEGTGLREEYEEAERDKAEEVGEVQSGNSESGQSETSEFGNIQHPNPRLKQTGLCLEMDYIGSDFSLLMESKDEILAGLKEKKIFDYQVAYITDVRILVNPLSRSSIKGDFAGYSHR